MGSPWHLALGDHLVTFCETDEVKQVGDQQPWPWGKYPLKGVP